MISRFHLARKGFARRSLVALVIVSLLSLSACTYNWGSFRRVSMTEPVKNMQAVGTERVSGSACRIFLRPRHIADAARSALEDAPGAKGLKNVRISAGLFGLFNCVTVEGMPVK